MSANNINIKNFVRTWKNRGYEKGESQTFWLNFLRDVFDITDGENFVKFEVPVKLQHTNFIDAFFPDTKVIVEQKSFTENFSPLKPYEQAQKYIAGLPVSMHPQKIIVCNFADFFIYDMETLAEPIKISIAELPQKFKAFDFLIDKNKTKIRLELEISLKAGEIVGKIYDALKKSYINPNSDESLQSLNKLCVRLVFCLYAESAGIFKNKIFTDYLRESRNIRRDLQDLFKILNTPENLRDPYLDDNLKIFPYVNGGLFAENDIEIPNFNDEIKNLLFDEAANFNWSGISPTIFGAVFESTLNPVTRRAGGMHYTSVENIHKVIDTLFLDDLHEEFKNIRGKKNLLKFQDKIANLKFFDPACGSGNFLTETFISLRRLENEILKKLLGENILIGEFYNPIKVSIAQFYGVEINDFAVAVAQTALWIADLQMKNETQEIIHRNLDFLPLKTYANIFEGNALRMNWNEFLPQNINFIFGNPPFVGKTFQTSAQKADMKFIFANVKNFGNLDYVAAWYKKTSDFLNEFKLTKSQCAFVSTNSITQGEQVGILWRNLAGEINFAFKTFKWNSESENMAAVHCVIIGFSLKNSDKKFFVENGKKIFVNHINGYLLDAPDIFLQKRSKPLQNFIPKMFAGNRPADGGNLILSEDEKNFLISKYPESEKFIKILIGAEEFLHNKKRYCLWLVNATPSEIKKIPPIYERIKKCREDRLKGAPDRQKLAEIPHLFREQNNPKNFLFFPQLSSEKRKYIPIGFLDKNFITVSPNFFIENADLYLFGILTSSVHMAWTKTFCGRLEMRFRYSATIIYNNFPFCEATEENVKKISATAEKILEVRKKFAESSLADLYDENLMPRELRLAHKKNDAAVMAAYGFAENLSEEEILAALIEMYKKLTETE
ncbi:MAG: class I SAM-dependent DNA methyltransferase [Selenomonadaceae bacterium]|nr:class I SAM-dependent DNA methyltransferase [Selenomonadaceae bacterium]